MGKGYGQFMRAKEGGRTLLVGAHRYSWELAHGPIPPGMRVLHRCDNPPCVNPAHLFLGTTADNNADKTAKGRNPGNRRPGPRPTCRSLNADAVIAMRDSGMTYRAIAEVMGSDASVVYRTYQRASRIR